MKNGVMQQFVADTIRIPYACGAHFGASSTRANNVRSTPICVRWEFSLFVFCLPFCKNKCAKLWDSKNGFVEADITVSIFIYRSTKFSEVKKWSFVSYVKVWFFSRLVTYNVMAANRCFFLLVSELFVYRYLNY